MDEKKSQWGYQNKEGAVQLFYGLYRESWIVPYFAEQVRLGRVAGTLFRWATVAPPPPK